ncbi:MAG: bifunctional aspartate kinase/homoserine dehydrogenase I [Sediminibacterium sp.]
MQVLKFGGSSVGSADAISKAVAIVLESIKKEPTIVVVSAMSGVTDQLLILAQSAAQGNEAYKTIIQNIEQNHLDAVRALLPIQSQSATLSLVKQTINELESNCEGLFMLKELSNRMQDKIVSYGEILSSKIIAASFASKGIQQQWLDARLLIKTNSHYLNAVVDKALTSNTIQAYFAKAENKNFDLYTVPGFIASDAAGNTTTLGRGGSDYTGAIFAAAVKASAFEIWTDVSGMMTADPRMVHNAKEIPQISYQEAMELSHFGAKVIYPPTIQPVMHQNIPVWIKNTFEPNHPGTIITNESPNDTNFIRGISSIKDICLLSLEGSGMVGIPGFSKRLFDALAKKQINIILITQSSSEHSICVGVNANDAYQAKQAVDTEFEQEINTQKVEPLIVEKEVAILALVGEQMKNHPGVSGKMFGVLGRNGINVRAIAQGSSEKNITAVIATSDVKKAINVLHEEFFETSYKQVNVYIAGAGNVGSKLIAQLKQQVVYLKKSLRLQINIVGIANSKRQLINVEGIDLNNWKEQLAAAPTGDIKNYVSAIEENNLRNSVFVDVTAHETVANVYAQLLEKAVSVVACNKIACSSPYEHYAKLKSLAREFNASFLFETNVGASLPIIGTLNDLIRSGDSINKIEAVLSGTLNFVFNNYAGGVDGKSFSAVVRQAQLEGYTEPDPRLDLGGTDVMRKIMILAREAGTKLEMTDILNEGFLPESCFNGSVEDFYGEMEKQEAHFKKLYDAAAAKGCKLKFVANFENDSNGQTTAKVGLQHIQPSSDFYHLYGKDNLVLFYSMRYPELPLVIKGAGAGADVTASGVFADIIRAGRV